MIYRLIGLGVLVISELGSIFVKTLIMEKVLSITELKARAYDLLANLEYLQKELAQVNQQIAEQMKNEEVTDSSVL